MKLDVPFIADEKYARYLAGLGSRLESVHFSLGSELVADARNPLRGTDTDALVASLKIVSDLPCYLLVNARMHSPELYFDPVHLAEVASMLERLRSATGLTGIVFSDAYYLNALSKTAPSVCSGLEAVPSVNCMIDSAQRADAWLRLVQRTCFALPRRLVLDRSLNRDPKRLELACEGVRKRWPQMRILLLANEGCLPGCPYKPAHDAQLAVARMPGCHDRTYGLNRDFGCLSDFHADPWLLFTSPFIRPEDVARYEGLVDGIKVCGRERGGRKFLQQAVGAYVNEEFAGNLLAIMDTLGEFESRWEVRNEMLPADFHDKVTSCGGNCMGCGWCKGLARDHLRELPQTLPDFRGGE